MSALGHLALARQAERRRLEARRRGWAIARGTRKRAPGTYTFEAVDFFTDEPQTIGRLELEQHGRRFVLLARRAESTGGRWAATWCGAGGGADAEQLPAGLELGAELVDLLEQAPTIDARQDLTTDDRRTEDAA